jgi:hypothetical protein
LSTSAGSAFPKGLPSSIVQLFTLPPSDRGGRSARKGYRFQDWWIAYKLVESLSDSEDLVYARIEGVEDLDLIVRREDTFVEQYIQLKSKEEGSRSWTIASIEQEKVFTRFFRLYRDFQKASHHEERGIEFILIVEGDLAKQVRLLQEGSVQEKQILFVLLATSEIRRASGTYESKIGRIQDFLEKSAGQLLEEDSKKEQVQWKDLSREIAEKSDLRPDEIEKALSEIAFLVAAELSQFLRALKFVSRSPGIDLLREAAIPKIMRAADVAVSEANCALDRLMTRIEEESSKPSPSLIDRNLLVSWLELTPKPSLRTKPEVVMDYIERDDFLETFSQLATVEPFLVLYGLSKIGKSQFVSRYIDQSSYQQRYLWFTFSAEADDSKRLMSDIAFFVGKVASVWQLAEDKAAASIGRQSFLERLSKLSIGEVFIVLDDSHKCADPSLFGTLHSALSSWTNARLLLLSEGKIEGAEMMGAKQVRLPGFEPAEALKFIALQNVNPKGAVFEILALTIKFEGHPLMLKVICQSLPPEPTAEDVKALSDSLPSISSAKAFLEGLSNQVFVRLLQTSEQRLLLSRLALLPGRFDWRMAQAVAEVEPKLNVTKADWQYMKSVVLDEVDTERCLIPQLLKEVGKDNLPSGVSKNKILIAAAHKQLKPGRAAPVQFIDFHWAIFSLILGEAYAQAAMYFVVSYPRLFEIARFADLQVLFLILNGELMHAKLSSPYLRWQLLTAELAIRARDPVASTADNVPRLLARMRPLEHQLKGDWRFRFTITTLILMIRSRKMFGPGASPPSVKAIRKVFASAKRSIRIQLKNNAVREIGLQLKFFKFSARFCRVEDIDLLKDVLLAQRAAAQRTLSDNLISELYSAFAVNAENAEAKRSMLVDHAAAYESAGFSGAYFASKYALALLVHERDGDYASARNILQTLLADGRFSSLLRDRTVLAIADTFCAEKNYAESARSYALALRGHHTQGIRGHIQGRLIDTLALSGDSAGALAATISILRRRGVRLPTVEKARLYARLAYLATRHREMNKAAIACLGLRRAADKANSDELQYLCLYVAGWALGRMEFKEDLLIPRNAAEIRDIFAFSESIDSKHIEEWKSNDRLKIKSYLQISAIFELQERYKRALSLLSKAKAQIPLEPGPNERKMTFLLNSRISRLQLVVGQVSEATALFTDVLAYQLSFNNAVPEVLGLLCCDYLESVISRVRDEQLQSFAEGVTQQCAAWPKVRAGVLLWYARQLFDRLLVQRAKIVLRESEDAARIAKAYHIVRKALAEKLFVRTFQVYSTARSDWGVDLIGAIVELGQDEVPDEARRHFAKQLEHLCAGNSKDLQGMNAVFLEQQEVSKAHPFEVAAFAVWKACTAVGVPTQTLSPLANFLKAKAPFLSLS